MNEKAAAATTMNYDVIFRLLCVCVHAVFPSSSFSSLFFVVIVAVVFFVHRLRFCYFFLVTHFGVYIWLLFRYINI